MNNYDYAIVGAGSAGCVLANRLSANPDHRSLLIEAGGGNMNPMLHIPAGWASNFRNPKVDWAYTTQPESGLNDRSIYWPRGKVLGGSSAINGMIYVRGVPLDFDRWAQTGATGWSYDEVLPYFRKAEAQQRIDDEFHGRDGPLYVEDVRDKRAPMNAFVDGMAELGMPRNADFNGGDQAGCGYYQFNQHSGRRWSTATAYLDPVKRRANLDVSTNTLVHRVLFEARRVTGLEVQRNGSTVETIGARHVILCGGSINSPQLLELSGIGNGELLQRLGINVVYHLPEVGENLQDHVFTKSVYTTDAEDRRRSAGSGTRARASMRPTSRFTSRRVRRCTTKRVASGRCRFRQ